MTKLESKLRAILEKIEEIPLEELTQRKGYFATVEYSNLHGAGTWTEGVDFVVLDDDTIVYRLGGDWRDDSDWEIGHLEKFVQFVMDDVESFKDDR